MVKLRLKMDGQEYFGMGFARCSPSDCWFARVGLDLAIGRAQKEIVRQLKTHMDVDRWYVRRKPKKAVLDVEARPIRIVETISTDAAAKVFASI